MHIISRAFEHQAILHTLKKLEKEGFQVELLPVHENGMVSAWQVADAIRHLPGDRHVRQQRDRQHPAH